MNVSAKIGATESKEPLTGETSVSRLLRVVCTVMGRERAG